jgi:hypothetical protein
MRRSAFIVPTFALLYSVLLIGHAAAQQTGSDTAGAAGATLGGGGGGVGAGTPGQSLNLTTLGLADAFGANDIFADTRRVTGQSAGAGGGNAGGAQGGLRSGGNILSQLFGGNQQTQSSRRTLRAPLRVDFDVIRPDNTTVATQLEQRFVHIKPLKGVGSNIQVQVIDRVATLTGSVNTAAEKDMAERITRLEPGISSVRNELTVRNDPK